VLLVAAAVAGAGGAVTQILGRLDEPRGATENLNALVAQADAALAAHREPRFEEAIAIYRKALPHAPDDAHLLSSLSRACAQYSQALRTRAEIRHLLRAPLGLPTELAEDPEAIRLANEAKLYGQRGAQRNPGNEEAGVALSDALRLSGNLVAARAEIDRVRATQRVPDAERLRVEALLAIDEAHGRVAAGRKLAAMAVAYAPQSLAARLLLSRCLAHDGDFEGSGAQLAATRALDPTHPALPDYEAELSALRARPAAAPSPQPSLATPAPAATRARPEAEAAPTPSTATPSSPGKVASGSESGSAFAEAAELARKGERLLESGSVNAAKEAFEGALAKVPSLPRARTGLGYVHLERGQVTAALGQFRSAASGGHSDALIGLGDAYRRLGRFADALRTYKSYLSRFPRGPRRSIAEHQIELLQEHLGKGPPSQ
jgi:tetratricopeptide (TPR) repeat protein